MLKVITPLQEKIQKKYENNKEKLNTELLNLYNKYNYKPWSSCLPLLLQFPFIIGLFGVIRDPALYVFTPEEYSQISQTFLWINDISVSPMDLWTASKFSSQFLLSLIFPAFSIGLGIIMQKQTTGTQQNNSMMLMMNLMMVYFAFSFKQGFAIYWTMQTAISILQNILLNKFIVVELPVIEEEVPKKKKKKPVDTYDSPDLPKKKKKKPADGGEIELSTAADKPKDKHKLE
jgi:YidC/Oxa1 family membrane protein insertase